MRIYTYMENNLFGLLQMLLGQGGTAQNQNVQTQANPYYPSEAYPSAPEQQQQSPLLSAILSMMGKNGEGLTSLFKTQSKSPQNDEEKEMPKDNLIL